MKHGDFYIGKDYDIEQDELGKRLVYESADLTTHAVCVGMTGSGKTGLGISLLEEAGLNDIPAIIIDPKGDMVNLALSFPEFKARDFRQWIDPDAARREGISEEDYARGEAEKWRDGLQSWGIGPDRVQRYRDSVTTTVYTPGSNAGVPVSILSSFKAPDLDWERDIELLNDRIQGTASALLGLAGIDADPVQSQEHILVSSLIEHYWSRGEDIDLPTLLFSIQNPPVRQLGVFDVETFLPQKDRFKLAMRLNNIIAAPSFKMWLRGMALDIDHLLGGSPQHSIFYIAHLNDAERMFFVTMLLNQVLSWMRTQPGSSSLRALLYMDEVFGFFPPLGNPPAKQPMLTLMKQGRAFGMGAMLCTQNPADLDYKSLTNAGTWFVGRLQAERDKMRLMDGLQTATEGGLSKAELGRVLSSLGQRVFLMHNVHGDGPTTFQTRWAMNYLAGPMTRLQIRDLKDERISEAYEPELLMNTMPPTLSPDIDQFFIPHAGKHEDVVYVPMVIAKGRLHFVDDKRDIDTHKEFAYLTESPSEWDYESVIAYQGDLVDQPPTSGTYETVPPELGDRTSMKAGEKALVDYLYNNATHELMHIPELSMYSYTNESREEFLERVDVQLDERLDFEMDKVDRAHDIKRTKLVARITKKRDDIARLKDDVRARKRQKTMGIMETILGMFTGRRSRAFMTRGASHGRMVSQTKHRLRKARHEHDRLIKEYENLQDEYVADQLELRAEWRDLELETIPIRLRRRDVTVETFGIVWVPHSPASQGPIYSTEN